MTLLLGNILTLSPPSPKRGKSLRMSLRIFTIDKKSPTCKKSALWLNLQSIWNGVPPRHTHGENRYSKSTGLIGLISFTVSLHQKLKNLIIRISQLGLGLSNRKMSHSIKSPSDQIPYVTYKEVVIISFEGNTFDKTEYRKI